MKKTMTSLTIALTLACGVATAQQAMTEQDVRADLAQQGYNDVHDVDFHDGAWTAQADNQNGKDVKLQIDPDTGRIIGSN